MILVNEEWEKEYKSASVLAKDLQDDTSVIILSSALLLTKMLLTFREKQINEEFLNQKANQHDNEVRKQFKEELTKLIENRKKNSYFGCIGHRGLNGDDCEVCQSAIKENGLQQNYNFILSEIKSLIEIL